MNGGLAVICDGTHNDPRPQAAYRLTFVVRQVHWQEILLCLECARANIPAVLEDCQPPYREGWFTKLDGSPWPEWDQALVDHLANSTRRA